MTRIFLVNGKAILLPLLSFPLLHPCKVNNDHYDFEKFNLIIFDDCNFHSITGFTSGVLMLKNNSG